MNEKDDSVKIADLLEFKYRNIGGCENDSVCTYDKGYVRRQALFACKTCNKKTNQLAGICYPCSINCHENHELIEMHTKRNFRCDCGNSKLPDNNPCLLTDDSKDAVNADNVYNDNFKGLYCICKKLQGDVELGQWQCNICEDWFHIEHLVSDPKQLTDMNYKNSEEFTCRPCLDKTDWLNVYQQAQFMNILDKDISEKDCKYDGLKSEIEKFTAKYPPKFNVGYFWKTKKWRQYLCKCEKCITLDSAQFLTNVSDAVSVYMQESESKIYAANEEYISTLLGSFPHVEAMYLAESFLMLRNELQKAAEECAKDENPCMTVADFKKVFDRFEAKQPRLE